MPPSVSWAVRAALISSIMRSATSGSAQRTSDSSTASQKAAPAGVERRRTHSFAPVRGVQVRDDHRQRAAHRVAVADAAHELDLVPLDLLPPAPSVAALPPTKLLVHLGSRELQPGRQVLDDDR